MLFLGSGERPLSKLLLQDAEVIAFFQVVVVVDNVDLKVKVWLLLIILMLKGLTTARQRTTKALIFSSLT